jgi:hypothetical protein
MKGQMWASTVVVHSSRRGDWRSARAQVLTLSAWVARPRMRQCVRHRGSWAGERVASAGA